MPWTTYRRSKRPAISSSTAQTLPVQRAPAQTGPAPKPTTRKPRPGRQPVDSANLWFQLKHRPYRTAREREQIRRGAPKANAAGHDGQHPAVYHVAFTPAEVAKIVEYVNALRPSKLPPVLESLEQLIGEGFPIASIVGDKLEKRNSEDIRNFCSDLLAGRAASASNQQVLSLCWDTEPEHPQDRSAERMSSLLLAREMEGNIGFGRMRRYENFQNEFRKAREDGLDMVAEFTNCAGDIETISWVSDDYLVCGTTAHSDSHNQQYNKPGNLLLCSTRQGTLRAYPDHRIPRPRVENGENSTEAMRQSQDPWLYASVVSSDYDSVHKRLYTSSFDKTVKVWSVEGGMMILLATWRHEGNVNFVAAAKDGSGRVATAADVPAQAVRIYTVNPNDISGSTYQAFSCSRTDANESDKWAYYPATIQWGKAPQTKHLLAVGYSPRSVESGDDHDIPEDKRDTGEITLWDADKGYRVPVTTATSANVFEITWHPTLQRFICATSPCGHKVEPGIRTQVHIFVRDKDRKEQAYCEYRSLDCRAADINELTFMPNSLWHAYVTAACTDGKVYVWDTAQRDEPIHVLEHGNSLEGIVDVQEREKLDTGVKFTAWGSSADRLYTGSSDGVVKVWNVRNRRKPYVRTLLEAPGAISRGAFSPDLSKLAIGDATGRVFLFSVDKRDEPETHYRALPGSNRRVRRPVPFIPHPEPLPPPAETAIDVSAEREGIDGIIGYSKRTYFETGQLISTGNPVIGIVQGPNYMSSGLFCREAHKDSDPALPLLVAVEMRQLWGLHTNRGSRRRSSVRRLPDAPAPDAKSLRAVHDANKARDLDVGSLPADEVAELVAAGAVLSLEGQEGWDLEYEEMAEEVSDDDDNDGKL